jgi:hypothetical protein
MRSIDLLSANSMDHPIALYVDAGLQASKVRNISNLNNFDWLLIRPQYFNGTVLIWCLFEYHGWLKYPVGMFAVLVSAFADLNLGVCDADVPT